MKKLITFLFIIPFYLIAQNKAWSHLGEAQKVITKNEGQFICNEAESDIEFAYNSSKENFYFTKEGVVFEFQNKYKPTKSAEEKAWRAERKKEGFTKEGFDDFEHLGHRIVIEKDYLQTTWLNSNPNVEIIPSEKNEFYQSFSWEENGKTVHKNFIPTYNKITYKNIYKHIDIEYEMHPESGIKYTIIVHPGGNINDIQLKYSKDINANIDGTLTTKSMMGDIIDHRPVSFYKNNEKQTIYSAYKLNNNVISFNIGNYDKNKTLIIDPWTQTPNYNLGWDCVWECETDALGNTYTIGGTMPMVLNKYSATGTLVWTYNTPYDTTSWLGTFATDDLGNSYVTLGSTARIQKVNTLGTVAWNNSSPGGFFSSMEFWNIEFNCDQTKLVVGGTGGTLPPLPYIYDINMNTGNITSSVEVPNTSSLFAVEEVRAVASCGNGNYYYMTHKDLGYINDNLTLCDPSGSALFSTSSGFTLGYKCENWRVNNSGIEAMEYYDDFIFINRGNTLQKRKFSDASIVATANIPNGSWGTTFGSSQVGTSGIAIDDCGNIYVGTTNAVLKYDQNLTLLNTYTTTNNFKVWDVEITSGGEVIAVGGTGTSSSNGRSGYVESLGVSACAQVAITCCDATMCPEGPLCLTDPSFTITVATPSGVFAGTGITNTATGLFDPATAGLGTHQISYTLPCGSDTIEIVVNDCSALSVCKETNGDLTVSGGTGPYTWANWGVTGQTCVGGVVVFGICTGTWQDTYGWVDFTTDVTVTPPAGEDTIRVTSGAGTEYFIYDVDTVTPCNTTCDASINPAGPFCQNDAVVTLTATTSGGTWSGSGITNATTGTFDPSLSNPSNNITYTLPCGSSESITIITNANATYTDVQSACNTFTWTNGNGNTYTSSNNTATHTIAGGAANGCDSVMTLNLTVNYSTVTTSTSTSCNPADVGTNMTGPFTMANGCDSTHYDTVSLAPYTTATVAVSDCDSAQANSNWYYTSTTFNDTVFGGASNGCDSITTFNVTVNYSTVTTSTSTSCNPADVGTNMTGPFTMANGCDSTHYDTVSLAPYATATVTVSDCDSAQANSNWYYTSTTFNDTVLGGASNGCDSITTFNVTVNYSTVTTSTSTSCNPADVGTNMTGPFTMANGCDSTHYDTVSLAPYATATVAVSDCDSAQANGNWYYTSTTFNDTVFGGAGNGCDSITTFNVTVNYSTVTTSTSTSCNPADVGTNMTGPFTMANGCDSTHYDTVSLAPYASATVVVSDCDSAQANGNWYYASTSFNDTILGGSVNGCDSITTFNVTVNSTANSIDNQTACDSFTWIDGNTYTSNNNTATHTITGGAANGCDSVVTLNLTIRNTVNSTDVQTACNSYTWIDGNTYTSFNNTATYTITGGAANGCDSVVTLNLTISNTVNSTDVQTACNSYTWIDGNTYTSSNNTATHTITGGAANGCDSVVTLNLTISNTVNSTDVQTACNSYTWIDGNTYTTSNNTATHTVAGQGGNCDTLVTLNLTINNDIDSTYTVQACNSFTWINGNGNTYTSSNNTDIYTLTGVGGACDINVHLNLTINIPTTINLGNDTTIYQGESIELNATQQGGTNGEFDWNPNTYINCNDCINPVATPQEDIIYTLVYTNEFGCISTDDISILLRKEDHYCYFPTAFTPNRDNVNDIYRSICKNVESVELRVYNRWGELIYSGDVADGISGWNGIYNGKEQNVDVYTYYAKIKYLNGDTENTSGNFTLIR